MLDVALLTLWQKEEERYVVASARALPGDRLANPEAAETVLPAWMTGDEHPLEALARTATARLETFRQAHPAESGKASRATTTFAADAADMRAVLPRLAWNASRRLEWSDGTQPWLPKTLAAIQAALGAADPTTLLAGAPDTDVETAAALAELPPAFVDGLALDMTIETGGKDRLLIGSLPDEGDIYILAFCRFEEGACVLRRLVLISLLG